MSGVIITKGKESAVKYMGHVENGVLLCVTMNPACLNNYNVLILEYWMRVDKAMYFQKELNDGTRKGPAYYVYSWNTHRLTSPESITRAMRKLIKQKVVHIRKEDEEWRRRLEQGMRDYATEPKVKIPTADEVHYKLE